MKNIISLLVVVLFAVGGSVAGNMLRGSGGGEGSAHASTSEGFEHGSKSEKSHGASDDGHGGGNGHGGDSGHGDDADGSGTSFYKFSREFVVPIMADRRVKALVILHISLEVDKKNSDKFFSLDPKLRDNIMTTLIGLSNDGRTLEELTSPDSYETIRSMVLMNLKSGISEDIQNVLIMDVGKQDL